MNMIYIPDIPAQMIDNNKKQSYALQIISTGGLLQYPQERIGESGSECPRVESVLKRDETTKENKIKSKEK